MGARVAAALAVVLTITSIGAGAAAAPAVEPTSTTSFSWKAPANATGPLAVEVTVDVGPSNQCTTFAAASGADGPGPVVGFIEMDRSWLAISEGHIVQAHAADAVDTRSDSDGSFRWAGSIRSVGTDSGEVTIFIYNPDMTAWDNRIADRPIEISISCENPITVVSQAGGTELASFTQNSLEGGVGASYGLIADVSVAVQDGLERDFTADRVRFRLRGFQIFGAAVTDLRIDHPDGADTWNFVGHQDIDLEGSPGTWEVELTRAGAGLADPFLGMFAGLDDVENLDELV